MNGIAEQSSGAVSKRTFIYRIAGGLFLLAVGMAAYSLYVALRSPDSQETVLLGQRTFAAGSPAGLRVLVRHRSTGQPIGDARVVLKLSSKKVVATELGAFATDENGTLSAAFNFPQVAPGKYDLVVEVSSPVGHDRVVREVEAQHPVRLVVTSDKPLYQPGQTIHLRSLLLNGRTQKPFPGEPVIFEILDAKGNKVFKESRTSSEFGIASADFELASELNPGRYEIRASSGETIVARTVEVNRYVLPKFTIQFGTAKAYYSPGEAVAGTIEASYFFGKPVAGAEVKLTMLGREERTRTDSLGKASFNFVIPDQPAELSATQEVASLDLKAELRDTAGHVEEKTVPLTLARRELTISVIPEAGALVPGVENIVYVTTTRPDGSPAVCELTANGTRYQSDSDGVTTLKITPSELPLPLDLTARVTAGRDTTQHHQFETGSPAPPLLLRPDHAVYNVGQTVQLSVFSPEDDATLFLDALKDGQTVLTRSFALKSHRTAYALELPDWLTGMVTLRAYRITEDGDDRGCSRMVYVNPRSALQVRAEVSKSAYRPSEAARIEFHVRDAEGHPTPAALGISAVDEAVFGLTESRSGFFEQDADPSTTSPGSTGLPARFVNPETDSAKAQALLATIVQASLTPSLEELSGDYFPPRVLQRLRSLKGTREYERLRRRPEYAEAIRLLEEGTGSYNLREATGPEKVRAITTQREAYFKRVGRWLEFIFVGAMIGLPIWLGILSGRIHQVSQCADAWRRGNAYIPAALATRNALGALAFFPFGFYPAAFLLLASMSVARGGWFLMAIEAAVISLAAGLQLARLKRLPELEPKAYSTLLMFVRAFLGQFFISRLGLFIGVRVTRDLEEGMIILWALGSMMAPIFLLGFLNSSIRRECGVFGIGLPPGKFTIIEALVVVAIMAILSAMLLPSLARAKARGSTVSLMNDLRQVDLARQVAELDKLDLNGKVGQNNSPRLRRDFPETLFWRPELITDDEGRASLEIPLADSITTWRMSVDAISARGALGAVNVPIKVFQDFFVDLDLPASLSLDDEVSVPVTCYNYLKEPQQIHLAVGTADWLQMPATNFAVRLGPGEVTSVHIPLKAVRVGEHLLRVTATGSKLSDAVERAVRVEPTGTKLEYLINDVLRQQFVDSFVVPPDAIPGSQKLVARFYPSRFSEVVEGLDSIFAEPHGCFEQTSSTTYPNVMALAYLQSVHKLTPEVEARAHRLIRDGYQRLLTFEAPGGGFEWFGHAPAHVGLTAYGVLEFTDMARVTTVDPAMIKRTLEWLYSQQRPDGSWQGAGGPHGWSGGAPVTAYVAWALAEAGERSAGLRKALEFLRTHPEETSTTYLRAVAANALLAVDRRDEYGNRLLSALKQAAVTGADKTVHWSSDGRSITHSYGQCLDVEVTALSAMAFMKAGIAPETVRQSLAWLSRQKDEHGTWQTTQATILAMRALIQGTGAALGQEFTSSVTLKLNGETIESFELNKQNSDVLKQIDLTRHLRAGENRVELFQSPAGELAFQLNGVCWLPGAAPTFSEPPLPANPLEFVLKYDRTSLRVNDTLKCTASIRTRSQPSIHMPTVDLRIPPGFEVDTSAFEALVSTGRIAKFEAEGSRVILYLRELVEGEPFRFDYSLRAKHPLRAQAPRSVVYEYYRPDNRAESKETTIQVVPL